MISNQIIQSTIEGIKNVTKYDLAVLDIDGKVLASTFRGADALIGDDVRTFIDSSSEVVTSGENQFFKVFDEHQLENIVLLHSTDADSYKTGLLTAFQIQCLITAYKERFDKDNFIKNLLLDNLLVVDIYNRAKKLRIRPESRRVVFILETGPENDRATIENVRTILGNRPSDFVTAVDESSIIIVKELSDTEGYENAEQIGRNFISAIGKDENTHIAYGTIVNELREVSRSYKEARMALDVGKIFFAEKDVIAYSSLGIGRLIYQLPIPLCKMFIKEIFANKSPDEFDEETITTINKFFENNLNVSETSRQLFIHRNTLVYRLDKLQKSTGLDLRVFEDAITFKIALMVVRYMKYMERLDY